MHLADIQQPELLRVLVVRLELMLIAEIPGASNVHPVLTTGELLNQQLHLAWIVLKELITLNQEQLHVLIVQLVSIIQILVLSQYLLVYLVVVVPKLAAKRVKKELIIMVLGRLFVIVVIMASMMLQFLVIVVLNVHLELIVILQGSLHVPPVKQDITHMDWGRQVAAFAEQVLLVQKQEELLLAPAAKPDPMLI